MLQVKEEREQLKKRRKRECSYEKETSVEDEADFKLHKPSFENFWVF